MRSVRLIVLRFLATILIIVISHSATALAGKQPVIRSVVPNAGAAGSGQLVTIQGFDMFDRTNPSLTVVTVTQASVGYAPFLYASPSNANEIYVRLPSQLVPGAATITVQTLDDGLTSRAFPFTVVAKPSPPILRKMVSSTDFSTPITQASPGEDVGLQSFGTDTCCASAVFTQSGKSVVIPINVTVDGGDIGEVSVVTVPTKAIPGPAFVQLEVIVNGQTSKLSFGVLFTVVSP